MIGWCRACGEELDGEAIYWDHVCRQCDWRTVLAGPTSREFNTVDLRALRQERDHRRVSFAAALQLIPYNG